MFGYVRVTRGELKVKEYELYRGTYCGLCRAMGKCTGQCSRMALSYDFAFLALVRITLTHAPIAFEQKRCFVHPLKKRSTMKRNPALDYCAGAAALLNYHKLLDDLADERGFKKLRATLLRPWMAHAKKKALRGGLHSLDTQIARQLETLSDIEKAALPSVNTPAQAFGELLATIVAYGLEGADARVASAFGLAIGKWIYMADAMDDWWEDVKKERYNPFALLYGGRLPQAEDLESIEIALKNELYEAEAAMDLMEFDHTAIRNILENILYLGMPDRIRQIRCAGGAEQDKSSTRKDGQKHERSL